MKTILALALLASGVTGAHADQTVEQAMRVIENAKIAAQTKDPRWDAVPKERRMEVVYWCYGEAGGNSNGDIPDWAKEAACLDRQLDGYARVHALMPPQPEN